ncbi:MAG: hypothetical protein KC910_07525 [Candidatus Eremiobacteraeota bacterium]|nr:hypothetical protein [Candidatus Eremiobacteraeota bacterium]
MSEERLPELPSRFEFLLEGLRSRQAFALARARGGPFRYASSRNVTPEPRETSATAGESWDQSATHSGDRPLREDSSRRWKVQGQAVDGRFKTYLRPGPGGESKTRLPLDRGARDLASQRQSLLTRHQSLRRHAQCKNLAIKVEEHPLLYPRAFLATYPAALSELRASPEVINMLAITPPDRPDTRKAVRELLRHGGFKPSGRNKPAWEFLDKACAEGKLASINMAVDFCNAFSLHAGIPISVLDFERLVPPLRIAVAGPDESYVFNPSGQVLDLEGLLTLYDANGPCGGPVKDSQRSKTHDATTRTLTVLWGCEAFHSLIDDLFQSYCAALLESGAIVEEVRCG